MTLKVYAQISGRGFSATKFTFSIQKWIKMIQLKCMSNTRALQDLHWKEKNSMSYNVFHHGASCTIQISANRVSNLEMMMMMMMMLMMMMNCFCGMFHRQKALNLIPSWDHCQKFSWSKLCNSDNHYTTGVEDGHNSWLFTIFTKLRSWQAVQSFLVH